MKRNRTLKVLNLGENKLDVQGLAAVAEALVTISPLRSHVKTHSLTCHTLEIQHFVGNTRYEQEPLLRTRAGRGQLGPYKVYRDILTTELQLQALRTAFTLNNALKRLFLSSAGMTSAGAICLAEFLPESNSLLHLDLTSNNLELAGVMALNQGLKSNHVMRCLDLNIPPGDEEMARWVPRSHA